MVASLVFNGKPRGGTWPANGKSREMKSMAKQIIVAQKKEIAQFGKWLAKQK